ncbi:hypothetical protein pEaSNUABM37_00332 [Erwinia phage pEa_SNUABM_37]|nr:hypothetical protein pEaSNUABM37_00332 [Erwinia phage pEa_SNUABM_37]QXO10800.1 hypothetical protein pEaSNUABM48_00332 [Erwinia phage pEa_SNUABM_48]
MNIIEYAKSIFSGGVEKRDLLSEVDRLETELTKFTLSGYKQAVGMGLKADGPNYYCKQISRLYEATRNENRLRAADAIEGTFMSLNQLTLTIPWLRKQLEKEAKQRIAPENLDFKTANFLRYIDSIDFFLRYSRSMLLVVTSIKASGNESGYQLDKQVLMSEAKFLAETAGFFTYLIGLFSQPVQTTEKLFDSVPTVVVSEADEAAVAAVLGDKVNAFRNGFIPKEFNVFFLYGKRRAERRVARLRAAEASAHAIELTLNKLQEQKAGGSEDPTLDKQISYYTNVLNKLNYEIETINGEA